MSRQDQFDLIGRDVFAATPDGFLLAIDEVEITVGIEIAAIAGAEPSLHKRVRGRFRHLVVAIHHRALVSGAHPYFTDLTRARDATVVINDTKVGGAPGRARRAGFIGSVVGHESGHRIVLRHREQRRDRHPISASQLGIKRLLHRHSHDLTQGMVEIFRTLGQLQQNIGHRTQRIELGRAAGADFLPEPGRRKLRRERKAGFGPQRSGARIPECIDMKERQTGIDHIIGSIAVVGADRTPHSQPLRMRTQHAL